MTDSSHLTVGALLEALKTVPPETPVLGHAGWDFPIIGCDHDEDGFVLFLDHEDSCSMVTNSWLEAARPSDASDGEDRMMRE